jgi:integrase
MRNLITAKELDRLTKPGRYAVGFNVYLQITTRGSRSWVFRYTRGGEKGRRGRGRHKGLGPCELVTLAKARAEGQKLLIQMIDNKKFDPLLQEHASKLEAKAQAARAITFRQCAERYIETFASTWKNKAHRTQWSSTLSKYAYPVFGDLSVADVDQGLVLQALQPIWPVKPETASRVRNRIELVLDWAKASGHRDGENPARWRGHLDKLLPSHRKVAKAEGRKVVVPLAALPYDEMGDFMALLRAQEGIEARALEFTILTAARTGEARGARWDEIGWVKNVEKNQDDTVRRIENIQAWVVPALRMKGGREHRVPLTGRVMELLESLPREGEYIFAGFQEGKPLHHQAMLDLLKRLRPGIVVHGFRSTFRDWAAEQTAYAREVCEMALAHAIGDKTEAAYQRGDLFKKRQLLMSDWAGFCALPSVTGNVVPMRGIQ